MQSMENIKQDIRTLYSKMNYEYTKELIESHLASLFALGDENELKDIYEKQKKLYEQNKEHYDNKPFR